MCHSLLRAIHRHDLICLKLHAKPLLIKALHGIKQLRKLRERVFVILRALCRLADCLHDMRHRRKIRCTDGQIVNRPSLLYEFIFLLIEHCKDTCIKLFCFL